LTEIVVCGPVSWNLLVQVDRLPRAEPHTVFAGGHHEALGGTSAGKALHLTELGRTVALHTVVGADESGRRVVDTLRAAGVRVRAQRVSGPTERHLNLMDTDGGRLSIYLDVPPSPGRAGEDAVLADAASARAVVMDLSETSRALLSAVAALGVPVWTDLHDYDGASQFHEPFAAAASYVFMNADGHDRPLDLLHRLVERGARLAVCTLGSAGAVAVDDRHAEHRVPAEPVATVVDTNGAGDGFLSGVLDAVLDGAAVPEALRRGAAQAARSLRTRHLSPLLDA
jgi:sugar/nucleoside kinase (ribokinase family)